MQKLGVEISTLKIVRLTKLCHKSVILQELVTLMGVYLLFSVKHDMLGVCLV